MTVKDYPFCELKHDPALKCVVQTWKGYCESSEFRKAIVDTLTFFEQNNVSRIISDTRKQKVVKPEDTDWVATTVNPKLISNGLRKMAFILPEDVFASLSVDRFLKISNNFELGHFQDMEEAKSWIAE
jgi:hypothetical protein